MNKTINRQNLGGLGLGNGQPWLEVVISSSSSSSISSSEVATSSASSNRDDLEQGSAINPRIPGISGIGTGIWDSFSKSEILDLFSECGIWD